MKDSETLGLLRLISTGNVRWSAPGFRVSFVVVSDDDPLFRDYDAPRRVVALSERLYHRGGYETSVEGRVALTAEGERMLAELESEER